MKLDWQREVVELHAFFAQWYSGVLEEHAFARFEDALADAFTIVGPDGIVLPRAEILERVRSNRGVGATSIEVRNLETIHRSEVLVVGRYEEHQTRMWGGGSPPMSLLSTAVFAPSAVAPTGVAWLTVHETLLPPATGLSGSRGR